jgi:imidazole glycerol-phosphate synthase subunit HisH
MLLFGPLPWPIGWTRYSYTMASSTMIVILDYDVGNLASISNMLRRIGVPAEISSDPAVIDDAEGIILPGVGAFDHAMLRLRESPLLPALERRVFDDQIPLLGLCLGAQLLTKGSEEGREAGLSWVDAETVRFDCAKAVDKLPIPHMGWSHVKTVRTHRLLATEETEPRFYFAHSYHIQCGDPSLVIGTAKHGYEFTAAIASSNIMGVQFHPEKSHVFGMRLLRNFCELVNDRRSATFT